MSNNRLFLVNTETKEYCCIAKSLSDGWNMGNVDILNKLLINTYSLSDETPIIVGTENDIEFYEKWIVNGINLNTENKWIYY